MNISPLDLVQALEGNGGTPFEAFVKDLLRLEAQGEGLSLTDIDFDPRTPMRDGGRDIVVNCCSDSSGSLIPSIKSVWSMKAGKKGKTPASLRKDVEDHPKIIEDLDAGKCFRYVVLQPCANDGERDKLRDEAARLCSNHSWDKHAIGIVFVDQLRDYVIRCPSLIPHHLPLIAQRLGNGATSSKAWIEINRWKATQYTPLDSRRELSARLEDLLNGNSEERYIHVAGWSGVGKSRLVAEALASCSNCGLVVVYQSWDRFDLGLLESLESHQIYSATVVVDEVDLNRIPKLASICGRRAGIRIISLGAAAQMPRAPLNCSFIERPGSGDLSEIIAARSTGLLDSGIMKRIAQLSQGDVRFAEMLCDAAIELGSGGVTDGALIRALDNMDSAVSMYFEKHAETLGDIDKFRSIFAVLTLLSEVGVSGDVADEIKALASFSQKNRMDLDDAIGRGKKIGVCRRLGDLLECMPRPLATFVFDNEAWQLIDTRLLEFYTSLPTERAQRAFLRRAMYCSDERSEEVQRSLADVFLERYKNADLAALSDPDVARTLRAFVETIPQVGMAWLRGVITRASPDDLREFKGSTGMFAPSYGRREVVWVCEHLRCFGDCFDNAEAILFQLAQAENEGIANNATAEWKQCFWWRLSATEVSFTYRVSVLLRRLESVTFDSAKLLLSGCIAALHDPMSGVVPPEFVGGRLTPQEVRPSVEDLFEQWDRVIDAVVNIVKSGGDMGKVGSYAIIENLKLFVRRGLTPAIRDEAFGRDLLDEPVLRSLRLAIDRLLLYSDDMPEELKRDIEQWRESLSPGTLAERIREVVGRSVWDHERDVDDHDAWRKLYDELAEQISLDPDTLRDAVDWLESDMANSATAMGSSLGRKKPSREVVKELIVQWLNEGRAWETVVGYFIGVSGDDRVLPEWATVLLDKLINSRPSDVVRLTVEADVTRTGLDRVYRALPKCSDPPSSLLNRLFGAHWEAIQQPNDQRLILEALETASEDDNAISCALHLITMWHFQAKDEIFDELDDVTGKLVHRAVDEQNIGRIHEWDTAASWWVKRHADEGAVMLSELMTSERGSRYNFSGVAEKLLRELATQDPDAVAEAISQSIQSEDAVMMFHVSVYHGLFEPLGLERIKGMIERLGEDGAAAIVRHLPDPDTDVGQDIVEWFLTKYAHNDRLMSSYLCGRHSGEVVWGHAFDRRDEVYQRTEPFMNDGSEGVRKWVQWERDSIDEQSRWERKRVDEEGRE